MIACRLGKLAMVASVALFAFVVTFDNIVDYPSNYDFVRHVLSMDTTFPGNALRPGRAITVPWAWTAAYWIIIGVEGLTCAAFAVASVARSAWAPISKPRAAEQLRTSL
jgi:predicted small integral membrane protein